MLMAHSEMLRNELHDSELAEKGDIIPVTDLYPDTFKNLLKYIYGYDKIAMLSFEEADELLYASQKYLMETLKNKLAARLMSLLTYDNVCTLMNNPVCFSHLELDSTITKILQAETDKVFTSPQFLNINSMGFLKILEQDALLVKEIEVWRAALQWAKEHNANTEDGAVLRQALTPHLKHIRLCTLTAEEIFDEVVPTEILSDSETVLVLKSVTIKKEQDQLLNICNTVNSRNKTYLRASFPGNMTLSLRQEASITILTKKCGIEILPFQFLANTVYTSDMNPPVLTYHCSCTITITHINDYQSNTSTEPPVTITFNEQVQCGQQVFVPIAKNGKNIQFVPNNKYAIKVSFNVPHNMYSNLQSCKFENEHFKLITSTTSQSSYNSTKYYSPVYKLEYRTVSQEQV